MAVLVAEGLELCRKQRTKPISSSEDRHSQDSHSVTRDRSGGRVCLPLKPKRQEVRAKTHVSPQAAVLDWKTCLKPLQIGQVRVGGTLDTGPKYRVKDREGWM